MTSTHFLRAALLAIATSLVALTGSAAAQTITNPPTPQPPVTVPIVYPCSEIASFSPASARPGEDVDIHLRPPSGRTFHGYTVYSVAFTSGASTLTTPFSKVAPHHYRAKVPLGATTGKLRVNCTITVTNSSSTATSATNFTPTSFGLAFNPSAPSVDVGTTANVTATLSHPTPAPLTLTLTPQSNAVSVQGQLPGAPGTVTIAANQQSATFSVRAHAAAPQGVGIAVSGISVASTTLTVTVPTPSFTVDVPTLDPTVNWGDFASYTVEVESQNGFAGTVRLTATGLPFGATAAPVNANVPAGGSDTVTFLIDTDFAATEMGSHAFLLWARNPNGPTRTQTLDLRVLPEDADFTPLIWQSFGSSCGLVTATVSGTNIQFTGLFGNSVSTPHAYYAWTPGCRGAVVISTSGNTYRAWIFNFGFDASIADPAGSRQDLGAGAWTREHFLASADGSYLIGVAESGGQFNANLYDMLILAQRPQGGSYSLAEEITATVVGEKIVATPDGPSSPLEWILP